MIGEANLVPTPSGLLPDSEGWFVVNVRDTAWATGDRFGSGCRFESTDRPFPQLGINLHVLQPGQPSAMYHRESNQEDFLVLAGRCVLLVEGGERKLEAWDFVHCPPNTEHVFVGAGTGPCVILMVGTRDPGLELFYPVSGLARRYEAGVEKGTDSPAEAYANTPPFRAERPPYWDELPWARK
jgi:uncharacterized cupin superfamily protein